MRRCLATQRCCFWTHHQKNHSRNPDTFPHQTPTSTFASSPSISRLEPPTSMIVSIRNGRIASNMFLKPITAVSRCSIHPCAGEQQAGLLLSSSPPKNICSTMRRPGAGRRFEKKQKEHIQRDRCRFINLLWRGKYWSCDSLTAP